MKRKITSCYVLVGCTSCGGESEFGVWVRAGGHSAAFCEACAKCVATWHAKRVQAKSIQAISKKLRAKKRAASLTKRADLEKP